METASATPGSPPALGQFVVRSADGQYERPLWLLEPPDRGPQRVGLFLDGNFYVERMGAAAAINELQLQQRIAPTVCLFVSHVDGAARHRDLVCCDAFARFVTDDVMGWVRARYPSLASGGHVIAGPSLGGLAAAHAALRSPQTFSACLSHSGSFWWSDEALTHDVPQFRPAGTRFWLSVGNQETTAGVRHPPTGLRQEVTQIAACERFRDALLTAGFPVHYRQYDGGHELRPWAEELPAALEWLRPPAASTDA